MYPSPLNREAAVPMPLMAQFEDIDGFWRAGGMTVRLRQAGWPGNATITPMLVAATPGGDEGEPRPERQNFTPPAAHGMQTCATAVKRRAYTCTRAPLGIYGCLATAIVAMKPVVKATAWAAAVAITVVAEVGVHHMRYSSGPSANPTQRSRR